MALMDKLYDRMRDPAALQVTSEQATAGSLDGLRKARFSLVVTFRRDGSPVPSPVWMAVDGRGRGYLRTGTSSGKVKRIRKHPEVLITACNVRGKPRGPVIRGSARVLPGEEWSHAEATLASAYGVQRKAYHFVFRTDEGTQTYVEVVAEG